MNKMLTVIFRTLAAKAIPAIEAQAIQYYLQHAAELKGKADLALDYAMRQYADLTRNVPLLNTTTLDDTMVREQLRQALAWAWERADERVKQAARDVRQAETQPPVTDAPEVEPGGIQ
ncbi:hypothetical protein DAERI_060091 [Deinococcus aerius]|uniref:Uncharacterized protein n=1 Tax=Deinococcus aerius TaxID=200253 RepID=A0A2I9DLI5_9DEIO|nr:hypothetical protein [Deinococcus aerius]GBF05831.1 hypothetical protein DAERI_060091 [Deinococcus aerius]